MYAFNGISNLEQCVPEFLQLGLKYGRQDPGEEFIEIKFSILEKNIK
jgi:hypothetical protein